MKAASDTPLTCCEQCSGSLNQDQLHQQDFYTPFFTNVRQLVRQMSGLAPGHQLVARYSCSPLTRKLVLVRGALSEKLVFTHGDH